MMKAMSRTFRRSGTLCLGVVLVVGVFGLTLADSFKGPERLGDMVVASIVLGSLTWGILVASVVPAIRASDDELVVQQPLSEWRVRWGSVRVAFGGDVRFRLSDGRVINPWAFSPSILARLLGDRMKARMLAHLRDRQLVRVGEPGGIVHAWRPRLWLWASAVVTWFLWFEGLRLVGREAS